MGRVTPARRLSGSLGLAAVLALTAHGCSTGPQVLELSGTWTGTALLPDPYPTTLALTQSGNTIAGTIEIVGILERAFVGTLDEGARTIDWAVFDGCEEWSGTFSVDSDGTEMSGPVLNDLSDCPSGADSSGTISVTKQ